MGKIKGVLFDFDGVVLDSEIEVFRLFQKTLSSMGINTSLDELLLYVGKSSYAIAEDIIKKHNLMLTVEELQERNRETGNFYCDSMEIKPFEDFVDLLILLKSEGVSTAVVSSTRSKNVITALNRMDLLKYMDIVICGDMVKETKPSPDGYLMALELMGLDTEVCVAIEDSPIGISAAKNANLKVLGFKGSSIKQDTSKADKELYSYCEVIKYYKQIR